MENSTKERLTGALILVAALVILVPEMLSGPGDSNSHAAPAPEPQAGPPLRTYDISLNPGASSGQSGLAPASADEIAAVPPPVTTTALVAPVAEAPVPAPAEQGNAPPAEPPAAPARVAEAPKPAPKPATSQPKAATGQWWVQVGVFASADNAQRLARELKAAGMPVVVSQITAQGKQMHRVRAGPAADQSAAKALQARLAAKGHKSTLVAP